MDTIYTNHYKEYGELMVWAFTELQNGNRVKASKIAKAAENMDLKHNEYLRNWCVDKLIK